MDYVKLEPEGGGRSPERDDRPPGLRGVPTFYPSPNETMSEFWRIELSDQKKLAPRKRGPYRRFW